MTRKCSPAGCVVGDSAGVRMNWSRGFSRSGGRGDARCQFLPLAHAGTTVGRIRVRATSGFSAHESMTRSRHRIATVWFAHGE